LEKKEIIIIGAGVAGLSAGIYARLNGFRARIFEMNAIAGGQCTAWDRKGFRFDYCIHWLIGTRSSVYYNMWRETHVLGDSVQVVDSPIHSYVKDEKYGDFIIYSDIDRWQEYLVKMAPEDEKSIRKMCRQMKLGSRIEQFEMAPELRKPRDYMRALMKVGRVLLMLNRLSKMTATAYFHKIGIRNERLTYFLKRIFGETNYSALVVVMMLGWFHIRNAGYPMGGSLPIARRMTDRFRSLGGELILRQKVESILVENDQAVGIRLSDGTEHRADFVISAADGYQTLFHMLPSKYLTARIREAYESWELYTPFVQTAFGVNAVLHTESVTTTCYTSSFDVGPLHVKNGYSILNLSFIDPTLAPPGKTTIIIRFDSPWEQWENLQGEQYDEAKEAIRSTCVTILEKHFPGASGKIEVSDVATPKTIVKYTGVWKGAYEGFLPTGNMVRKTLPSTLPALKNFRLIGQWAFPGGGFPPSVQSGKWAIQAYCHALGQPFTPQTSP
jgi:phytoene dehydrogenase-like protein